MPTGTTSWAPDRKVLAGGGLGTSAAVIVSWLLRENGVDVPAEVSAAMGSLISILVAYLIPNRP
jgi:putative flippase GtrA